MQTWFLIAVLFIWGGAGAADDSLSLATKCSGEFQKVMQCMPFATGKAAAPSKDCCDSVTALKTTDPTCLCWIIQQIHNETTARSYGVQEARLLQLPAACKLANTSVADCPNLLHLPANSSEAAIFNNVTAEMTPPAAASSGGGGTPPSADDGMWWKAGIVGVGVSVFVGLTPLLL